MNRSRHGSRVAIPEAPHGRLVTLRSVVTFAGMAFARSTAQNVAVEIVVGVNEGSRSGDAIALATALARSFDATITVVNIYPVAYEYPSSARVDAEWREFLHEQASEQLDLAREMMGAQPAEFVSHGHRSSGVGLAEVAAQRGADFIVIGSAPGGSKDRISGGSTSDQLLHGSPVPVAIAPHDYQAWAPANIQRAVVAYQRTEESAHCLRVTARFMQKAGFDLNERLKLITLVQALPRRVRSRMEGDSGNALLEALTTEANDTLTSGADLVDAVADDPVRVETEALAAENVVRALSRFDWLDEDVLVVGSTGAGPVRRVFLGDMSYKLIRGATVPTIVVPRSAK